MLWPPSPWPVRLKNRLERHGNALGCIVEELQTINQVQAFVDTCIRHVGGYGRPLSAVARLLEDIGELAAEITSTDIRRDRVGSEAADVFVITVCLANQYCADLGHEYKKIGLPSRTEQLRAYEPADQSGSHPFGALALAAGVIGRIVNSYEGDPPLKRDEDTPTLAASVAKLHVALFRLAHGLGCDVMGEVEKVLQASLGRGAGRFELRFDPVTSEALRHFETIRHRVPCPFAHRAKIWGAPTWVLGASMAANLQNAVPSLVRFTRISQHEHLDGYVLEIAGEQHGQSTEALAETLHTVLAYLSAHDPAGVHCLRDDVESPGWQFSFNGERLFIITFAPCYDRESARYAYGERSVFILFQPEHSFDAFDITEAVRERIRKGFADHGQSYDMMIMNQPLEAPRYVKPLTIGAPAVAWWHPTATEVWPLEKS